MLELKLIEDVNMLQVILRTIFAVTGTILFFVVHREKALHAKKFRRIFTGLIAIVISTVIKTCGEFFIKNSTHELIFVVLSNTIIVIGLFVAAMGIRELAKFKK